MGIQDPGRGPGVLPIPLNRTVFCVLHAKMRVCDKLMKLLATEAVKNNMKDKQHSRFPVHVAFKFDIDTLFVD